MAADDLVVAITGASGSAYGVRLLETLLRAGRNVQLTISPSAAQVMEQELERKVRLDAFDPNELLGDPADVLGEPPPASWGRRLHYHHYMDFVAGIASGSFLTGGMVICPCSMGTVAAVAHGLSQNLIHRAADVHLKEKRKLILVPRETPLHLIQVSNLVACAEAGAVVLPASPAYYTKPRSLQDAIDFVVGRICDQLAVPHRLLRPWGDEPRAE